MPQRAGQSRHADASRASMPGAHPASAVCSAVHTTPWNRSRTASAVTAPVVHRKSRRVWVMVAVALLAVARHAVDRLPLRLVTAEADAHAHANQGARRWPVGVGDAAVACLAFELRDR